MTTAPQASSAIEESGRLVVDPDCAWASWRFPAASRFRPGGDFLYRAVAPFGQEKYVQQKLDYLVEKGFEIGSHTYSPIRPGRPEPEKRARSWLTLSSGRINTPDYGSAASRPCDTYPRI